MLLSSLLLAASAVSAHGQDARRQYIAANPVALVFETLLAEYERGVSRSVSVGVSTTILNWAEELSWFSVDAKVRYYPNERVLRGFSIGGLVGFSNVATTLWYEDVSPEASQRYEAFSTGITADYNWLMGGNDRFVVGTGIGGKRLWGIDSDAKVVRAHPIVRFSVGFSF
jgi:hypothetical protein